MKGIRIWKPICGLGQTTAWGQTVAVLTGVDADLGWVQRLVLLVHVAVSATESRAGPACTRDLEGHDRAEGSAVLGLLGDDVDLRLPARGPLSAFVKP